jgi:hypothetical protein
MRRGPVPPSAKQQRITVTGGKERLAAKRFHVIEGKVAGGTASSVHRGRAFKSLLHREPE